ncbi:uncharacterized protein LAESUDRAFT_665282 [Laetiporus sulphureus 93-53]|uniref:LsmAD domain-containing protein n=1 Tax=Laetiporus sulphureus 93-53 TaxID=1314785 RepID=A0A165BD78_9APHY|nr:uncharacterized protein LAESUDRAFT_665282 [Laetiporus sulphureus 93-53]KZT00786.1 hypothetical protein LAESUDRAFT_665282 [Laetiporus sulphureus 93-53]
MATTARQPKPQRKGMPEPAARRPTAWTGARASPTYSPSTPNARLPNGASSAATSGAFPPLGNTNSAGSTPPPRTSGDGPHDRVLAQLSGLVGTTITLSTKTHLRYEGSIASTSGEGDTTGVTLRDVKELTTSGAPLREQLFIAATNIDQWSSGPADSKAPATQPAVNGDTFKTDVDISKATALRRERALQAWQPSEEPGASASASASTSPPQLNNALRDELTFGPGAGGSWDQFAANEKLFGVRAGFDEEAYTTRLDRNAPNFKERERRAAAIANEIMQSSTSNPHIAEERTQNLVGDSSTNEEEKYGAVVRSANAYVPPGARKGNASAPTKPEKQALPKVSVEAPDGSSVPTDKVGTSTSTTAGAIPPKAGSPAPAAGAKPSADDAFREFVSSEKDRLMKRKQVLMKNEMDKRMAELVKFSKSFKLNKPIPEDLVPILAKDEEKQRQIREKSTKDAESSNARAIGTSNTITASATVARLPGASNPPGSAKPPAAQPAIAKAAAAGAQKLADQAKSGEGKRVSMYIQPIPAFKGKRSSAAPTPAAGAGARAPSGGANAVGNGPLSPTAANRLNVNASSFRPNPKSVSPSGPSPGVNGSSSSPKPKQAEGAASPQTQGPPNPFFGTRIPKKAPPVHIKDDFNPFKYNKVVDAAQVGASDFVRPTVRRMLTWS